MQEEPHAPLRYTYLAPTWRCKDYSLSDSTSRHHPLPAQQRMGDEHLDSISRRRYSNAIMCSIASDVIRTLPELHGATHAQQDALSVYIPDELPILAAHEMPHKEAALTAEITEPDHLKSRLETPQNSFDVDTLFPHTASYASTEKPITLAPNSCRSLLCSYRPTDSLFFPSVKTPLSYTVLFSYEQLAEIKHYTPTFVFSRFYIRAPENHCRN